MHGVGKFSGKSAAFWKRGSSAGIKRIRECAGRVHKLYYDPLLHLSAVTFFHCPHFVSLKSVTKLPPPFLTGIYKPINLFSDCATTVRH